MSELRTPFRDHYEHSRALDAESQLRECADYVQHPEVLITEFMESYYLVEREWDPEAKPDAPEADDDGDELVLEPFADSLPFEVVDASGRVEHMACAGGAFDPLPGDQHPALRRRGLDYVGMRSGSSSIVLGVTEAYEEGTSYLLLLRALNCFAEVASPFQLARLRERVIRERIQPDATFDLQIGLARRSLSPAEISLRQLTRDLAEAFKTRILAEPQFAGTLGRIECVGLESEPGAPHVTLRLDWRV